MKGSVKQQWGKLTDDDLTYINGSQENLVGKLQERYGMAKEEAQKKADEFWKTSNQEDMRKPATGNYPSQQPTSQHTGKH